MGDGDAAKCGWRLAGRQEIGLMLVLEIEERVLRLC